MHADPALLLFLAGNLTGVAVVLLALAIPNVVFIVRHVRSRRKAARSSGPLFRA